jgi:hypothetical protein
MTRFPLENTTEPTTYTVDVFTFEKQSVDELKGSFHKLFKCLIDICDDNLVFLKRIKKKIC